jgi:SRSO17 transposase
MTAYVAPYRKLLNLAEQREHLGHMMVGLTSDLERKSSEPIAVLLGLPRRLLQNFVGMSRWLWEPLRQQQRREVREEIGIPDGTLIIDPSSVPKKGKETVGVARQWCGRLGKVDNCVVGVHAAYVGRDGQAALVGSELYLPRAWADDMGRRAKAHVPAKVRFATKVQIGLDLAVGLKAELPFNYVLADEEYGRSAPFRDAIRRAEKHYVVEVPRSTVVRTYSGPASRKPRRVDAVCRLQNDLPLPELLVAYGEKEPIRVRARMTNVTTRRSKGNRMRETLIYTVDSTGEEKFYLAHLVPGATLEDAVRKARTRHRVEEVFEEAKGEVGMDHFECRAWHGWHHHMTLVQMAHWFLVREQRRLGKKMSRHHRQLGPPSSSEDVGAAVDSDPHPGMAHPQPHPQRRGSHQPLPRPGSGASATPMAEGIDAP